MSEAADPAGQIQAYVVQATAIFRPSASFIEDIEAYGAARRLFDDHLAIAIDFLADLVATGVRAGQFRPVPPRLTAEVLSAAASQFAGRTGAPGTETDLLPEVTDIVLHGLVAPNAKTARSRRT